MAFFDPATDIILISSVLAIVTKIIQWKFLDMKAMKANQKEMKAKQEKLKLLMNKEDAQSKQEYDRLNKEMMALLNKTMQSSFKQMAINLPVFGIVFWWMGTQYSTESFALPIAIPWWTETGFAFIDMTNWFGWYFVSYLVATIVIAILLKIVKLVRGKTE
jgi:uncharacterized membrane protein (DUF106 family)